MWSFDKHHPWNEHDLSVSDYTDSSSGRTTMHKWRILSDPPVTAASLFWQNKVAYFPLHRCFCSCSFWGHSYFMVLCVPLKVFLVLLEGGWRWRNDALLMGSSVQQQVFSGCRGRSHGGLRKHGTKFLVDINHVLWGGGARKLGWWGYGWEVEGRSPCWYNTSTEQVCQCGKS